MKLVPNNSCSDAQKRLLVVACRELIRRENHLDFSLPEVADVAGLHADVITAAKLDRDQLVAGVFELYLVEFRTIFEPRIASCNSLAEIESLLHEAQRYSYQLVDGDVALRLLWPLTRRSPQLAGLLEQSNQLVIRDLVQALLKIDSELETSRAHAVAGLTVRLIGRVTTVLLSLPSEDRENYLAESQHLASIRLQKLTA